ncbi:MAG: hypothetical protein ABR499_18300 [Gemmatimonadaceae bacterium]
MNNGGVKPDAIIAQLTQEARQLAAVTREADKARQRRSRATAAIRQELKKAMGTVTVIEGILMARVAPGNRQAMQLWRVMRRVPARAGRPPNRGQRPAQSSPPP